MSPHISALEIHLRKSLNRWKMVKDQLIKSLLQQYHWKSFHIYELAYISECIRLHWLLFLLSHKKFHSFYNFFTIKFCRPENACRSSMLKDFVLSVLPSHQNPGLGGTKRECQSHSKISFDQYQQTDTYFQYVYCLAVREQYNNNNNTNTTIILNQQNYIFDITIHQTNTIKNGATEVAQKKNLFFTYRSRRH